MKFNRFKDFNLEVLKSVFLRLYLEDDLPNKA